jgi:RNA polymerase sigma-70 factor (ECF subfamily)
MAAFVSQRWIFPRLFVPAWRRHAALAMSAPSRAADAKVKSKGKFAAAQAAGEPPPPDSAALQRFQLIMLPHLDAAYSFARYLCRGDAAAEDLVHDAFVRALNAFPQYRGGDAKAWILAIVRNCFLTWAKSRGATASLPAVLEDIPDEKDGPEAALARAQETQVMRRLIHALPAPFAEIIILREIEELSYREIAQTIDAPIGTVMSRLARARAMLAKAWRERGEALA